MKKKILGFAKERLKHIFSVKYTPLTQGEDQVARDNAEGRRLRPGRREELESQRQDVDLQRAPVHREPGQVLQARLQSHPGVKAYYCSKVVQGGTVLIIMGRYRL